jgi:hypothetical protein
MWSILILAVVSHIIKVWFYPYTTLDYPIRKVTFENICATNVIIFPFIMMSKNKILKDYMVLSGIFSGLISFLIPMNAMSQYFDGIFLGYQDAFSFEIIRYYFVHFCVFIVPFMMLKFDFHQLSIQRFFYAQIIFLIVLFIVFFNEVVITTLGWIPKESLFDPMGRNPSLIFGIKDEVSGAARLFLIFIPRFLTVHPATNEAFYWPVVWMIIPLFVYTTLINVCFHITFNYKELIQVLKKKSNRLLN